MLGEAFINDMLRDRRAWRRAVRQRSEPECLDPCTAAAKASMGPVFRRGCGDNVSSLRLLNSLRDCGHDGGEHRCQMRTQVPWNRCTRVVDAPSNPLHDLLLRQLVLNGFASQYDTARDALIERQKKISAQRQHERQMRKLSEKQTQMISWQQNVMDEETSCRRSIEACERRRKDETVRRMSDRVLVLLTNREFNERQAIFQEAKMEFTEILRAEDSTLQCLTAFFAPHHRTYLRLLRHEEKERSRILIEFDKQRKKLTLQLQSTSIQLIQAEIVNIREEERILKQIALLSHFRAGQ